MESLRCINRVMRSEEKKGCIPLELDRIILAEDCYKEILNQDELVEFITDRLMLYQEYEDQNMNCRGNMYATYKGFSIEYMQATIKDRRLKVYLGLAGNIAKNNPSFDSDCYIEHCQCILKRSDNEKIVIPSDRKKLRESGLLPTEIYLRCLLTHILTKRREMALSMNTDVIDSREKRIMALNDVVVLYQEVAFGDSIARDGNLITDMITVYKLK